MHNSHRQKSLLAKFGSAALFSMALMSGLVLGGCDKAESPVAVDPKADITLIYPVGGETFHVGETINIKWSVKEGLVSPITSVDLMISNDDGITWKNFKIGVGSIPDDAPSWGNFPLLIRATTDGSPAMNVVSAKCRFRVQSYTQPDRKATTASTFTILAAP
jgi:hypothetical protein